MVNWARVCWKNRGFYRHTEKMCCSQRKMHKEIILNVKQLFTVAPDEKAEIPTDHASPWCIATRGNPNLLWDQPITGGHVSHPSDSRTVTSLGLSSSWHARRTGRNPAYCHRKTSAPAGPMFTKRTDVLPQGLVKSPSCEIQLLNLSNHSKIWLAPRPQRCHNAY